MWTNILKIHIMLECCLICEEIRAYNINTEETYTVHRGTKIVRICEDPAGSLLTVDHNGQLCQLGLDKENSQYAPMIHMQAVPSPILLCRLQWHFNHHV